jgi:hypothetical protein
MLNIPQRSDVYDLAYASFFRFKFPFLRSIRNHFTAEYTPYEWPGHCEVAASERKILHIAFSSRYGSFKPVKYLGRRRHFYNRAWHRDRELVHWGKNRPMASRICRYERTVMEYKRIGG